MSGLGKSKVNTEPSDTFQESLHELLADLSHKLVKCHTTAVQKMHSITSEIEAGPRFCSDGLLDKGQWPASSPSHSYKSGLEAGNLVLPTVPDVPPELPAGACSSSDPADMPGIIPSGFVVFNVPDPIGAVDQRQRCGSLAVTDAGGEAEQMERQSHSLHNWWSQKDAALEKQISRSAEQQQQQFIRSATRNLLLEEAAHHANPSWLMIPPDSARRIIWDVLSCMLLVWDCIFIPLGLMGTPRGGFLYVASWVSRVFWSIDLPINFLAGYRTADGRKEMRPMHVAWHYFKTGFFLDAAVVALDWVDLLLDAGFDSVSTARMGKSLKIFRLLKVMRLLRLLRFASRMPDIIMEISQVFRSGVLTVVAEIAKVCTVLVLVCHVTACMWFQLAAESDSDNTWLQHWGYAGGDETLAYVVAFHWALTQFCGSMEVFPQNLEERVFAILFLLIAFFMACGIVSKVTSSVTKLALLTVEHAAKMNELREFLAEAKISRRLVLRILRNAQHSMKEAERNMPESSIQLFSLISTPLKMEMHFEQYVHVLAAHKLFKVLADNAPLAMKYVCHTCIRQESLMSGDMILEPGTQETPAMLFLESGEAWYVLDEQHQGQMAGWCCEAALWTEWPPTGMLLAKSDCIIIRIDAEAFRKAVGKGEPIAMVIASRYGKQFIAALNSCAFPTDLPIEGFDATSAMNEICSDLGLNGGRKWSPRASRVTQVGKLSRVEAHGDHNFLQ
mmetsp:Transcript_127126/g.353972  ORF Transcript_127126/g.353972 Transcript_127126/m.353972 type:complete len:730 (+) Transcript_127126:145-2334(+)